jgi:Calx-beta domain
VAATPVTTSAPTSQPATTAAKPITTTTALIADVKGDLPTVNAISATVKETNANKPTTFKLRLTKPASGPIEVKWRTVDGSAKAGSDFSAVNGTATFASGAQSANIGVTILGDKRPAKTEEFTIELVSASGAVVGRKATIRILDNDSVATKRR